MHSTTASIAAAGSDDDPLFSAPPDPTILRLGTLTANSIAAMQQKMLFYSRSI